MKTNLDEESIFKPEFCAKPLNNCPPTALLTWHPGIAKVARSFGVCKAGIFFGGIPQDIFSISFKGKHFLFAHIAQGGPNTAAIIEELKVMGVKQFVFIGCCGSLFPNIGSNIIIPTKALRDEGVSFHYIDSDEEFIEIPTCPKLIEFFNKNKIPFVSGPTWTTDTPYRETPTAVKKATQRGCLCVEMECASLMAVSDYLKVDCYQFLFTADSLTENQWNKGTLGLTNQGTNSSLTQIALEFCLSIS